MAKFNSRALTATAVAFVAAAVIAASCAAPFVMDAQSLKGQTITYYGSNGKDTDTFVFSADGLSGTWDQKIYYFSYPTEEAETAGDYTGKAWYQVGGHKASFTFNPETFDIVITMNEMYEVTPAAASAGTYYAADFAYQSLKDVYSLYSEANDYTAYSIVRTTKAIFTQDNCSLLEASDLERSNDSDSSEILSKPAFGASGAWSISDVSVRTFTLSTGESGTYSFTSSTSFTLSATEFTVAIERASVETIGSAEPSRYTVKSALTCSVDAARLVGSTEDDETFDEIWKDGNIVTFDLTRTRLETIEYDGATAPSAPAMEADGSVTEIGSNAAGSYYYTINVVPTPLRLTIAKNEGYVSGSDFLGSASRDL